MTEKEVEYPGSIYETLKNFMLTLKQLGYSDWWVGQQAALLLRTLDKLEETKDS